jgi:sulfide dehydrogenase [flavocytochrome c] flavoprotein chain
MGLSRRDVLKYSGILAASTAISTNVSAKDVKDKIYKAPLANTNKPRVIVVGGGFSGLTVAKYTKLFAPSCEVILVEQRDHFVSCPVSNLWIVDKIDLEFLTHDYLQAARENNYTYFHASAIDLDKKNKILKTSNGDISYDYIVFAPGIDYDYSSWTTDIAFETRLRQEYPAGFKPGSEHMTLRSKVLNFKGGNFILTVPKGNYRCLPAPYERACIIADYFRIKKLDAKVILLDENNTITIKEKGFQSAFETIHKGYLEYYPNSKIENIDLENKMVETELDEFKFEDAAFYPHVRGGKILEKVGIAKDTQHNKLEGNINFLTYEAIGEKDIFISGDARPMGFSKSGNTSYSEAQFVAKIVASKINKEKMPKWESPTTTCFSAVSIEPQKAIYIYTQYAYTPSNGRFVFDKTYSDENWNSKNGLINGKSIYQWADSLYTDMFKA